MRLCTAWGALQNVEPPLHPLPFPGALHALAISFALFQSLAGLQPGFVYITSSFKLICSSIASSAAPEL